MASDDSAFAAALWDLEPVLRRFLAATIGADGADDLTQETLIAAWSSRASYRGESSLRSWVCGIALHKGRSFQRRRCRERSISEAQVIEALHPDAPSWAIPDDQDVPPAYKSILDQLPHLPDHYRRALELRYLGDRTVEEVQAAMGLATYKTAESLLERARVRLRELLSA